VRLLCKSKTLDTQSILWEEQFSFVKQGAYTNMSKSFKIPSSAELALMPLQLDGDCGLSDRHELTGNHLRNVQPDHLHLVIIVVSK